jgi:hypothetical protein
MTTYQLRKAREASNDALMRNVIGGVIHRILRVETSLRYGSRAYQSAFVTEAAVSPIAKILKLESRWKR